MKKDLKSTNILFLLQVLLIACSVKTQNMDSLLQIRAATTNPTKLYEVDMLLAKTAFKNRDFEVATFHVDKAIGQLQNLQKDKFKHDSYYLAGKIVFEKGQFHIVDSIYTIALQYATNRNDRINTYIQKSLSQLKTENLQKMMFYLSKTREYIGKDTINARMVDYYYLYCNYYLVNNDYFNALESLLKANEIRKKMGLNPAWITNNHLFLYEELGEYKRTIDMRLKLLQKAKKENDYTTQLYSYLSIAGSYIRMEQYDSTQKYCYKIIELKNKKNVSEIFGTVYYLLGMTHLRQNQLDSAKYYFQLGIDISLEQRVEKELGTNYFGMIQLYMLQGNTQIAKSYAEKITDINNYVRFRFNNTLATFYADEGNYKKAFEYVSENMKKWKKQGGNSNSYKFISNLLNDKYEREKEAARLEKENGLRIRNLIGVGLGLILLLVLGWSITVYRNNKRRKQYNQVLQTKNDELKALDEIKTRFFANVSHEFKTPLTLILNPIRRLLTKNQLSEEDKFLVQSAEKNSLQLLELTNQVLELTKFEVNKVDNHPIVFNLNQTIGKLYADFESLALSQKIQFEKQVEVNESLNLYLDYTKFTTIIKNLISNAIKFTSEQGQVIFKVTEQFKSIEITIEDTGRGIHPKDLPHIFDRYYQAKASNSIQEGGTGIGLAICSEYTKLLGGSLTVQSEYEKGSKFIFSLPKVEAAATALPNTIINETSSSKPITILPTPTQNKKLPTVLIVEDNVDMQNYLQLTLKDYYQLEIASHGKAALAILKQKHENIQFIISDVMMPEMNGYELLAHLKKNPNYASIPTIMLTALSGTDDKLKALRIGIDDYLTKPFIDEELLTRMDNLLQNREERTAFKQHDEKDEPKTENERDNFSQEDQAWLERLERYVHRNLAYSITADLIADHLHISRVKLYKKLKQLVGLTPNQYVNEIRYQTARRLIDENNHWTIKAIASQVGFKDEKNFARNFKQKFGKYPSELL